MNSKKAETLKYLSVFEVNGFITRLGRLIYVNTSYSRFQYGTHVAKKLFWRFYWLHKLTYGHHLDRMRCEINDLQSEISELQIHRDILADAMAEVTSRNLELQDTQLHEITNGCVEEIRELLTKGII